MLETVRALNVELQTHVTLIADLQGPKLRVGEVEGGAVELAEGEELRITSKESVSTSQSIYINYEQLASDVKPTERILLDDGKLQLEVVSTDGVEVVTKIIDGGTLSSRKGVNLPNTKVSLPSLTEKDEEDFEFALEHDISWIAVSFVRSARDIIEIKHRLAERKSSARIIAKIEKPEAIADIDAIIQEADAIMVARGDLGVETPMQTVPLIQKMIVRKCLQYAKPVIIATQMMESMIENSTSLRELRLMMWRMRCWTGRMR